MGVPKFYRWISERYPCLSEVVKEFQLPEFDNLYLDMNGIIHVCSHPDDENPHFRITEEKIFKDICHYIDFLFRMIKPRKVFFMAVDGVAPRAKMNQQRGRRFRSAREAEEMIKKAQEKGEVLPTEKRFDSNCITPGTEFMVRLQEHLKYFVVEKITNDPLWQGPKVYLSGHETPGEGEHKVMDFIRYSKSQADYDPDTRHCLYGLDADLIMLGLTSHEPHFSLLREEVRFGGRKDRNKRPVTPEETTFHLLHLSLMRDYLAYEFSDLKGKIPFPWNLENIIDDWIMMGFLVGNDFIPHLPHLHIHHDALPLLWKTYKNVLPSLDGYINEGGHLNLVRLEKYFEELSKFDVETFESAFSDLRFLESKLGGVSVNESIGHRKQRNKSLQKLKIEKNDTPLEDESANPFSALESVISDDDYLDDSSEDDSETIDEYDDDDDDDGDDYNTTGDEFYFHKRDYYMNKMEFSEVTPEILKDQAHGYIIAIQWILLYYFEGCPSWSWFYPHHYAPYISDVKGFSDMKITFDLSKPFLPFQQLMAVLPAASKDLLPPALQTLMTDAASPVIDFYPVNFETDLNGKQQDWEAVVLIPFIDERRLLEAMASKEHLLTKEEKSRNRHGPHLMSQYTTENMGPYPSSLPGVFPDLPFSRAQVQELDKDLFRIEANRLRKGLLDTVRLDVYFPGFPTLRFIPHTHELVKAAVKVFQHISRGENMVLRVQSTEGLRLEKVADELLGKVTHVGWPHLHEAKVMAVANESYRIELIEEDTKKGKKGGPAVSFSRKKLDETERAIVARQSVDIKEKLMGRFGIDVGKTEIIVYASRMTGRTYTYGTHGAISLEKQFASEMTGFLHQMTVKDLQVEESAHTTFKTLEEVFPVGSTVFMVGNPHYGAEGKVKEIMNDISRVRITLEVKQEPDFRGHLEQSGQKGRYMNNYQAAQQIGIDAHILSRITGTVFVEKSGPNGGKANIGLNLKFTKRGEEVPGYTMKTESGWYYSYKCVKTVGSYINRFPDLWLIVQQQSSVTDNFPEDVLFPEGSKTKLSDVVKYLEELPCSKVPRVKFGSEILDEEEVEQIERMTACLKPQPDIVKMKVKPRLLFRPLDKQGSLVPDPGTDFHLYDRVVVVKTGYSVPFGRRGTIIGIPSSDEEGITPNSLYDVVFDEVFAGGLTLRCSPGKGYRVPGSAMLNLTYGEFRKGQPNADTRTGGRQLNSGASWNNNSAGNFGAGYNNSNNVGGRQIYNDRVGSYGDRAAMRNMQQQHGSQQFQQQHGSQQFQQQHGSQQFQQQPVKWDKGQPLFGQVFVGQNHYGQGAVRGGGMHQPKFVTPRVQGSPAVYNRNLNQENRGVENSEFSTFWKNLQTHQNATQGTKASDLDPRPLVQEVHAQAGAVSSQKLNYNNQTSTGSQHGQQKLSNPPVSSATQNPGVIMTPASKQGQAFNGRLQPQLGGLLPMSSGHVTRPGSDHMGVSTDAMTPQAHNFFREMSRSNAVPAGAENSEFLAMFNSLKIQNEELKRGSSRTPLDRPAQAFSAEESSKEADLTLKQLLKIGTPAPPASESLAAASALSVEEAQIHGDPGTSAQTGVAPSPVYGRQVSLQELFEEVNRQMQREEVKIQQQVPASGAMAADIKLDENRDPVAELEAFCKNILKLGPPKYEHKSQPKQNAYIAIVILSNEVRYEGSLCKTKEEASKSAASMALLCLKSRPSTSHPVITYYPPAAQRSNVNRFFSVNSAFSPIGIPGPNPSVLPRRPPVSAPVLLTPQHFINQPPPPLALHQLLQQQHQKLQQLQQQHQLQNTSHHVQNYGQEQHQGQSQGQGSSNGSAITVASGLSLSTSGQVASAASSSSSSTQQFIPLQVSRNQKTPSRRKDSESEKSDGALTLAGDIKNQTSEESVALTSSASLHHTRSDQAAVSKQNKNGVVPNGLSPLSTSTSSSGNASKSVTPTARSSNQKKKSRIAANFGLKLL